MHSLKLIFVVNLVILLTQIAGRKACYEEDRKGLLELKSFLEIEAVNGSDHVLLPSWVDFPKSDCCGWDRVTCNSTTGRIVKLSLFNLRKFDCFTAVASDSPSWNMTLFQSFKELKTLSLANNCMRWKQKQGYLRLQQLETLDLSYNGLTSSHLHSLRKLKSLKNLILSGNFFNGSFPAPELSPFENLETLDLSRNLLRDSPTKLDSTNFSKLRAVILSGNHFSTDIMRFLGSFPLLKSVDLSMNNMEGALSNQDLVRFGRLEVLDLSHNQLEGGIPHNIGKLSSVKALYLTDNQFNGFLPVPGLCELRRLQVLDIHDNCFQGTLPPCLSNLTSLKVFDLHHNLFSGPIAPNSIPSQQFLWFIDISYNDFEGSFSLSSLFNHSKLEAVVLGSRENKLQIDNGNQAGIPLFQLKALRLSNCNMKNVPHFLLNQHSLTWVDISHSMLNGALPSWLLENNTDLKFLSLRNNSFTGKLEPLPQHPISAMVHMDVSYNYIDGHLPKDFGTILPNLEYLNLSYNFFEGELPPSIGAMRNLSMLDLSFNNLSGEVPKALVENCTDLVRLMLDNNNFHGEFFSNHFNLSNIRVLNLGNNEFTGSLITKREFYSGMIVFDVSNNNMTGKIPHGIDASVLLLQNNSFQGQIPCEAFHNAQVIDISHNFLSGPIPSCLSTDNFAQVLLLNLRNNRLSGNIPPLLSLLPSVLKFILLGHNLFSGLIPRQLCLLREISIMDLSYNSFSGSLPSCLSDVAFGNSHDFSVEFKFLTVGYSRGGDDLYLVILLHNLYDSSSFLEGVVLEGKYVYKMDFVTKNSLLSYKGEILSYMSGLDLSCNNLTGAIPESLGKLASLHALNLSHNHLTGLIPVTLSNLSQVESLDFSYNNLSGTIPSELVDLNFLAAFSVAHNNLSGRVPDKGQFATFGNSSFEGNPFLSGLPSEKNRSEVVEAPLPLDETEEKWYEVDPTSFFASFVATYCVVLLTLGAVIYINPYWRRRWSHFIQNSIYSCYYFVVDALRKLATNFNN
ncbi:receptor like protein 9 [Hibiscus trionum]|uniref:Receptor like protein 9 n=1 Tax=Hibiscus trionum TaxID=183268 RepID=A0A9W7MPL6_HIBTR|nr:receptor like protein 9 [Hibiscus trionum]